MPNKEHCPICAYGRAFGACTAFESATNDHGSSKVEDVHATTSTAWIAAASTEHGVALRPGFGGCVQIPHGSPSWQPLLCHPVRQRQALLRLRVRATLRSGPLQ
eukprot:5527368-Prymnesium_polylepis.1